MSQDFQHRTLRVGGIETHYLEAGEGPDLVLLHGGEYGASAEATWGPTIGKLAETFHVIAPDMLGYGRTAKIYSFSDPSGFRMTHLSQLMDVAGVGDAFYVGNSAGGGTLLRSAVRSPSPLRMKKMVTICGNAGVFKSESQADLEDYTPSIENMWQAPEAAVSRREVADPGMRGSSLCRLHRTGGLGGIVRGPPEAAGT